MTITSQYGILGIAAFLSCAASAIVPATVHATEAEETRSFESRYDITLMGMQIGVAHLKAKVLQNQYKIDLWTRLTGLAGVMTGGKGAASASGVIVGGRPFPSAFAVKTAAGSRAVSVQMAMDAGTVRALKVTPPIPERALRIPIRGEDKREIVDPVSALLMPVADDQTGRDLACERTLPLFDGSVRFDVPLSYLRSQEVNHQAYRGSVIVCAGRYKAIAGHIPGQADTQFMENNKDIEVWLAPVVEEKLYLPYRISVRSPVGMLVIEASHFPTRKSETAWQKKKSSSLPLHASVTNQRR